MQSHFGRHVGGVWSRWWGNCVWPYHKAFLVHFWPLFTIHVAPLVFCTMLHYNDFSCWFWSVPKTLQVWVCAQGMVIMSCGHFSESHWFWIVLAASLNPKCLGEESTAAESWWVAGEEAVMCLWCFMSSSVLNMLECPELMWGWSLINFKKKWLTEPATYTLDMT